MAELLEETKATSKYIKEIRDTEKYGTAIGAD